LAGQFQADCLEADQAPRNDRPDIRVWWRLSFTPFCTARQSETGRACLPMVRRVAPAQSGAALRGDWLTLGRLAAWPPAERHARAATRSPPTCVPWGFMIDGSGADGQHCPSYRSLHHLHLRHELPPFRRVVIAQGRLQPIHSRCKAARIDGHVGRGLTRDGGATAMSVSPKPPPANSSPRPATFATASLMQSPMISAAGLRPVP
jgi:hypothetical protein